MSAFGQLWDEYHNLNQLWEAERQDDPDSITQRQAAIAEQMVAMEAQTLGEVAVQAKVLAICCRSSLQTPSARLPRRSRRV